MTRKCIISAVVMFAMSWALSFVVHGLLLAADYPTRRACGRRRKPQSIIGYLILAQAIFGAAFAWVYYQGKEDKPWLLQGIRFGLAMAALTVIPTYLIYHVVTPIALAVVIKQIVFDRLVLMGVVLAWINR